MEVSAIIPSKDQRASLQRTLTSNLLKDEIKEVFETVIGSGDDAFIFLHECGHSNDVARRLDSGVGCSVSLLRSGGGDPARHEYAIKADDDLESIENSLHITL